MLWVHTKTYHIEQPGWLYLGAFKDLKQRNWCLTEDYLQYMQHEEQSWMPDADYYMRLISRLVDSIFVWESMIAIHNVRSKLTDTLRQNRKLMEKNENKQPVP